MLLVLQVVVKVEETRVGKSRNCKQELEETREGREFRFFGYLEVLL